MFNLEELIGGGGLAALVIVGLLVFAETGLLIGVILPGGDSMLLLAGSFAATGRLPLIPLLAIVTVCAVLGDNAGYEIGNRTGHRIFKKKESFWFKPDHLVAAQKFYEKHGGKTILLSRFVPMVRTFAPLVAGAANMDRKRFMMFNVIGAVIQGVGVTMLGYGLASVLGEHIHDLEKYLLVAVGLSMCVAFFPAAHQYWQFRNKARASKLDNDSPKIDQ